MSRLKCARSLPIEQRNRKFGLQSGLAEMLTNFTPGVHVLPSGPTLRVQSSIL